MAKIDSLLVDLCAAAMDGDREAAAFMANERIKFRVQREKDCGIGADEDFAFAIAITIEIDADLPIHEEVVLSLPIKPAIVLPLPPAV